MTQTKANRNTWWVTRPKRSLAAVPGVLRELAAAVSGQPWREGGQDAQRAYERQLEASALKANRPKRDPNGGGPRTYVAWLRSLGLLWEGADGQLYLTLAGEAIVQGDENLMEIMSRQVLHYQFPSYFSTSTFLSRVDARFKVRPFVFILQLLLDPRLGGYLTQKDDVAKIAVCYGENNSQACVDDVVERIVALREHGDKALPADYLSTFASGRSAETSLAKLSANLNDIANTMGNWLSQTQLVTRSHGGEWRIADGAEDDVRRTVDAMLGKKLLVDWTDQERFQRRYGLTPGKSKDTRAVQPIQNVSAEVLLEREIVKEYTEYASTHLVSELDEDLVDAIAARLAADPVKVRDVLRQRFSAGYGGFLMHYTELAQGSNTAATKFEQATTEIFSKVFGYQAKHIGAQPLRPDVVLYSETERYGAILDTKAYAKRYTLSHDQRGVMRNYVVDYPKYKIGDGDLAFFSYVSGRFGPNIDSQLAEVSERADGVPGSAITAHDIVLMCKRHLGTEKYTHAQLRDIFSGNKQVQVAGHERSLANLVAAATS
ncbi:hypothetical protein M3C51_007065 [Micrococcus luteus]|nr:hypothetical protein [Micrococcus luteus]